MTLANANAPILGPLRSTLASRIAMISYTLYLVHVGCLTAVPALLGREKDDLLLILLSVFIAVAISAVSYFVMERRAIIYGRGLAGERSRT